MRKLIIAILLIIIAVGISSSLQHIPFGVSQTKLADHYISKGKEDTGAANIVTSVVVSYRGLDTLGEVTVLFLATIGLGAVLASIQRRTPRKLEKASLILTTGCKFLFPLILLYGAYIFIHGHLTPGGGFQGGAVIASAFVLRYLGCHQEKRIRETGSVLAESVSGLVFLCIGLMGLVFGSGHFLNNFLPKGEFNTLISAGIIPIIYIAIGFKVGAELSKIIDLLMEES